MPYNLDHTPWEPGRLAANVSVISFPNGVHQCHLMGLLSMAQSMGLSIKALETIETSVSIADDAIEHMMIMSRIQS